nr:uncharacterized protein LOC106620797 [Bactrocera oleae]
MPTLTLILPKITNDLPTSDVPTSSWPHCVDMPLADRHYSKPGPIDILIGMDKMAKSLLHGLRKGERGTPIAQNTFWEVEELPARKFLSPEESMCEELYDDTTERASVPLKKNILIGESRGAAMRALLRMEKVFAANERLHKEYTMFMEELISMGHMEPVEMTIDKVYYMPHHAVVKTTSQTTKLRVVFNIWEFVNYALMIGSQIHRHRKDIPPGLCPDYQRIVWRSHPAWSRMELLQHRILP